VAPKTNDLDNVLLHSAAEPGDANLDGKVNLTGLAIVLNDFGQSTPAWTSGNFDNAATIDLTDLADVLNNFGFNGTAPAFADSQFALTAQPNLATPEPTSLAILSLACLPLLAKRERR